MITGAHFLIYSKDADADRAFLREVLEFRSVDAGHGWLIFAMPPAEVAVHPGSGDFVQSHAGIDMLGCLLYLMCDDLAEVIGSLAARNVTCSPVMEPEWGICTTIPLPSGGHIGLYQPKHPTAIGLER